jgi:glycosyltransferase involved in cell wall biosynthesis
VIGKRQARPRYPSRRIAFPASTLCRKGAYELREAARALDLELVCPGNFLEGADFWSGIRLARLDSGSWLEGIGAVVLPSFVEHRPRRLLQAIEAGVPVVASSACGLHGSPGVVEVTAGKVDDLVTALRSLVLPHHTGSLERISAASSVAAASPVVPS